MMTLWQCPRCGAVYAGTAPVGKTAFCPSSGCVEVAVEPLPPGQLAAMPAAGAPPSPLFVGPPLTLSEPLHGGIIVELSEARPHFTLRVIGPAEERTVTLAGEDIEALWRVYRKLLVAMAGEPQAPDRLVQLETKACDACRHFDGGDQLGPCLAAPTTTFDPVTGQRHVSFEPVLTARLWGACGREARLWEPVD